VGEGYCFLIDGFSYMAVIASLLAMRVAPAPSRPKWEPSDHHRRSNLLALRRRMVRVAVAAPAARGAANLLGIGHLADYRAGALIVQVATAITSFGAAFRLRQ